MLIDFWTYTCINCLRTLPYLQAWDERYRDRGLTIVGVHTPEFGFEKDTGNVADAIARNHLRYPVAQDNDYGTWDAWGNQYWPAKYLIDTGPGPLRALRRGRLRQDRGGDPVPAAGQGSRRARRPPAGRGAGQCDAGDLPRRRPRAGLGAGAASRAARLPGLTTARPDRFALGGRWTLDDEAAEAVSDATLRAHVRGKSVYLVLGGDQGTVRRDRRRQHGRP